MYLKSGLLRNGNHSFAVLREAERNRALSYLMQWTAVIN
jgi:hypothetical protein